MSRRLLGPYLSPGGGGARVAAREVKPNPGWDLERPRAKGTQAPLAFLTQVARPPKGQARDGARTKFIALEAPWDWVR